MYLFSAELGFTPRSWRLGARCDQPHHSDGMFESKILELRALICGLFASPRNI